MQRSLPLGISPDLEPSGRAVVSGEVLYCQVSPQALGPAWVVGRIVREDDGLEVRFAGNVDVIPEVHAVATLDGVWADSDEYGMQLMVERVRVARPSTREAVVRYIAANLPGCGRGKAQKILTHFGEDALKVLEQDPERISEALPGCSESIREAWHSWAERVRSDGVRQRLILHLVHHGVPDTEARRVVRFFKSADVAEIIAHQHPYRLLNVPGFGWRRADELARKLGVEPDHPERVAAAIVEVIRRAQDRGHSALPLSEVWRRARALLPRISMEHIREVMDELLECGFLRQLEDLVFRESVDHLERGLAERCRDAAMLPRPASVDAVQMGASPLSGAQEDAVRTCLSSRLSVLTGLPGTGKTTTVTAIVDTAARSGLDVLLLSPTGKAAARLSEVTGRDAQTVHRALGSVPGAVRDEPVQADVVVVDEAGMLDLEVAHWLLTSIDLTRTQVILVGDANQLPSVGHGNVLSDLIAAPCVPTSNLTQVFRQAAGSPIPAFARDIATGKDAQVPHSADIRYENLERRDGLAQITEAASRLMGRYGPDGLTVLTPVKRRRWGAHNLNAVLRDELNPAGAEGPYIKGGIRVKEGDRVIMTRNAYDLDQPVFNGEVGSVVQADSRREEVTVDFGDRQVDVSGPYLSYLALAWALTVHKAQGSEYESVILVLPKASSVLLNRQLLYTAVTRAKSRLEIFAVPNALSAAVETNGGFRWTGLKSRLACRT